jgi:hypothetical protein
LVDFDPSLTEIIFFDLEFYVPPSDRRRRGASLFSNPFRKGHFLLGGVFSRVFPLRERLSVGAQPPLSEFWIWQVGDEAGLLKDIYSYFQDAWKPLQNKVPSQADLIAVGIGISRFDLPALFSRSLRHKIARRSELFSCYFNLKTVDLSDVGILLPPRPTVLYPRTANELARHFQLPEEKKSGTRVWDMYDAGDYESIESRTREEVQNIIRIYSSLIQNPY